MKKIIKKPFTLINKYEDKFEYQKEPNRGQYRDDYSFPIIYRNAFKFDGTYNYRCGHYALFCSHTFSSGNQNHLFSEDWDINGWSEVNIDDFLTDEEYWELIKVAREPINRIYIEKV
jgi:hypothetical protein